MAYIYILHLHKPCSHAEHYLGHTSDIRARLIAHATGRGATYLARMRAKGYRWHLCHLAQCPAYTAHLIERRLKAEGHSPRYCPVCLGREPPAIEGTTPYPITELPFDTTSEIGHPPYQPLRILRPSIDDLIWIDAQQTNPAKSLGHIPRSGLERHLCRDQILLATRGPNPVGYTIWSMDVAQTRVTFHQVAVTDAHRFTGIGRALVESVGWLRPEAVLSCHVRDDLPANIFWSKLGFEIKRRKPTKNAANTLNHYIRMPRQ